MTFPRLPATAEIGWSPAPTAGRTGVTSAAYVDFSKRLAEQAVRWSLASIDFYPSPVVPWTVSAQTNAVGTDSHGAVVTPVASVVAPGTPIDALSATIDWGDGTTGAGVFSRTWTPLAIDVPTGPLPTATGRYLLAGDHTYADTAVHHGSVTITATGKAPVTLPFTTGGAANRIRDTEHIGVREPAEPDGTVERPGRHRSGHPQRAGPDRGRDADLGCRGGSARHQRRVEPHRAGLGLLRGSVRHHPGGRPWMDPHCGSHSWCGE